MTTLVPTMTPKQAATVAMLVRIQEMREMLTALTTAAVSGQAIDVVGYTERSLALDRAVIELGGHSRNGVATYLGPRRR